MKTQLSKCLIPRRIPICLKDEDEYMQVTVSMNGCGVSLRKKIRGGEVRTKNQFRVGTGQFICSRIDARNGAMGVVPPELNGAVVTGDFPTFDVNDKLLDTEFFAYLTRCRSFIETCRTASRGLTNRKRLKENDLLSISLDLPDISEQKLLSAHLRHIETDVHSGLSLCSKIDKEQDELLFSVISEIVSHAPSSPLKEVAPIIRRKVAIEKAAEYPELGIRSFGKGTFHKPAIRGSELGSKRLFRIEPGDLLFSNVFAWEGAIAVARPEDRNRFGSHRFITCLPEPSKARAEYLRTWFLTPEGMAAIRAASPGAAGRNKTLNLKKLESIRVPVPEVPKQRRFAEVYARIQAARRLNTQTANELRALMPAVLEQAFAGALLPKPLPLALSDSILQESPDINGY